MSLKTILRTIGGLLAEGVLEESISKLLKNPGENAQEALDDAVKKAADTYKSDCQHKSTYDLLFTIFKKQDELSAINLIDDELMIRLSNYIPSDLLDKKIRKEINQARKEKLEMIESEITTSDSFDFKFSQSDLDDLFKLKLENYELIKGTEKFGGFGLVIEAHSSKGPVMIKFPKSYLFVDRIKYEYNILHEIQGSEGITELIDQDLESKYPYFVMKKYDYWDLYKVSTLLPLSSKIKIAHNLAKIISEIHEKDIIHRDINPSNILTNGEEVRLIDFGLSKRLITEESFQMKTQKEDFAGTKEFMDPQIISDMLNGNNIEIDELVDIYSYGATLQYLFTRESIKEGVVPTGNKNIDKIIKKCTTKRKRRRYKSMKKIHDLLEKEVEKLYSKPSRAKQIFAMAGVLGLSLFLTNTFRSSEEKNNTNQDLQAKVQELEEKNNYLLDEKRNLQAAYDKLNAGYNKTRAHLIKIEQEYVKLNKEYENYKKEQLENENRSWSYKRIAELELKFKDCKTKEEYAALEKELIGIKEDYLRKETIIEELEKEKTRLDKKIENEIIERGKLEQTNKNLETEKKGLETQIQIEKNQKEEKQKEYDSLMQKYSKLTENYEKINELKNNLDESLEKEKQEIKNIKETFSSIEKTIYKEKSKEEYDPLDWKIKEYISLEDYQKRILNRYSGTEISEFNLDNLKSNIKRFNEEIKKECDEYFKKNPYPAFIEALLEGYQKENRESKKQELDKFLNYIKNIKEKEGLEQAYILSKSIKGIVDLIDNGDKDVDQSKDIIAKKELVKYIAEKYKKILRFQIINRRNNTMGKTVFEDLVKNADLENSEIINSLLGMASNYSDLITQTGTDFTIRNIFDNEQEEMYGFTTRTNGFRDLVSKVSGVSKRSISYLWSSTEDQKTLYETMTENILAGYKKENQQNIEQKLKEYKIQTSHIQGTELEMGYKTSKITSQILELINNGDQETEQTKDKEAKKSLIEYIAEHFGDALRYEVRHARNAPVGLKFTYPQLVDKSDLNNDEILNALLGILEKFHSTIKEDKGNYIIHNAHFFNDLRNIIIFHTSKLRNIIAEFSEGYKPIVYVWPEKEYKNQKTLYETMTENILAGYKKENQQNIEQKLKEYKIQTSHIQGTELEMGYKTSKITSQILELINNGDQETEQTKDKEAKKSLILYLEKYCGDSLKYDARDENAEKLGNCITFKQLVENANLDDQKTVNALINIVVKYQLMIYEKNEVYYRRDDIEEIKKQMENKTNTLKKLIVEQSKTEEKNIKYIWCTEK